MSFQTTRQNRNRALNIQLLDVTKITDEHQWDISAQRNISFRHTVEENQNPRADAYRYKLISEISLEGAQAAFSRACSSTTLFKIPPSIICDRTFARDAFEAYYVDAMHAYLSSPPGELRVEDLPLLKGPLHSRYFCSFARRPLYFTEMYERRRLGHWIPGDCPDLEHFSDLQKVSWFPKVEQWILQLLQPSGLPVPLPFVLYYFHLEIRNAERFSILADSERIRRLSFCVIHEYCILFLSTWWNELCQGGRAFIVKQETINVLEARCGSLQDIAGKPAQAIIERMRMYADMPYHHHNWMCFREREMESAPFIFAVKKIGVPDTSISSGRRLWCRLDHRSITVSRYSSETFRRLGVLDERLSGPDLDNVPGLLSLVREQDWARFNSLRVSDLLHNMHALYVNTRSRLDEEQRVTRESVRSYDGLRRDFDMLRDEMQSCKRSLDDTRYALEAANNNREDAIRKLDSAHREVDDTRRSLQTANNSREEALHKLDNAHREIAELKEIQQNTMEWTRNTLRRVDSPNGHGRIQSPRSPQYTPGNDSNSKPNNGPVIAFNGPQPTRGSVEDTVNAYRARGSITPAASRPGTPWATANRTTANPSQGLTSGSITPAVSRPGTPRATANLIAAKPSQGLTSGSISPTSSRPGTPKRAGSQTVPRRSLPKIKPGYPFFPIPTSGRSAQTVDKLFKATIVKPGSQKVACAKDSMSRNATNDKST